MLGASRYSRQLHPLGDMGRAINVYWGDLAIPCLGVCSPCVSARLLGDKSNKAAALQMFLELIVCRKSKA